MKSLKSLTIRWILVVVFFVSSFAGTALPNSASPVPVSRTNTVKILKQLGGYPCPNDSYFTCVTIDVPLDHFDPQDTRTIPVTFAVLPASGQRKGMFVVATGGPGTAGISLADSYSSGYSENILKRFDVVFFDQRGVGLSGGLACPQSAVQYYRRDGSTETPDQRLSLVDSARTFAEGCVNELSNQELLPYLGTDQAVEDLDYFRRLMKDNRFWLYGESYGTQYAQTYATKFGRYLAGMILDGTVDLTLNGFEFYAQQAQAFNDTLTATLEACNNDPICVEDLRNGIRIAQPELESISNAVDAYDYVAQVLEDAPVLYDFPLPEGGFAQREFTFGDLEVVASGQMYTEADRMMFNRALTASASYGSLAPLARLLNISLGVDPQTFEVIPDPSYSDAIFYAVECQDYGYPGDTTEQKVENFFEIGDQVVPFIPRLGSVFYGDMPCVFWPNATTDLTRPEPLTAHGIPTLVLNATADPATPVGNAISVYQHLKKGYLITQEGGPHVIYGWGNKCPDNLVTNFLVNGKVPAKRVTTCPGVIVEDYVPISPIDASEFDNLMDALGWTETEISYLPEYYYWDGLTPTQVGCPLGGTLAFEPNGDRYAYTLNECSFANEFVMTGTGVYKPNNDQFTLSLSTQGRWQCDVKYTRTGTKTRLARSCGKTTAAAEGEILSPVQIGEFDNSMNNIQIK
ncbi:MAG: alpha/beta hydrolase [Chloroflexota bacterium]